jgi:N-methylhydantoinase A
LPSAPSRSNKGVDPRDTALIAFGGGGALHACAIAREIFVPKVVVPKLPGTFSALGMLMASWRQDFVRTLIGRLGMLRPKDVEAVFAELGETGEEQIARDQPDTRSGRIRVLRASSLCRSGAHHSHSRQRRHMLTGDLGPLRKMFHAEHAKRLQPVRARRIHGNRQFAAGGDRAASGQSRGALAG